VFGVADQIRRDACPSMGRIDDQAVAVPAPAVPTRDDRRDDAVFDLADEQGLRVASQQLPNRRRVVRGARERVGDGVPQGDHEFGIVGLSAPDVHATAPLARLSPGGIHRG
jgi:hypothetical protein